MNQKTICYIDDNAPSQLLIKHSLSDNYRILVIDSATTAVNDLLRNKPDLVLLDVNLPQIGGYDLCRKIRSEDVLKDIPIIFLTCRVSLQDRLDGFEAGGDAYIPKPFQLDELKCIVNAQLNRHQKYEAVEHKANSASNMAWTMMQNNGEIGQVLQYARLLASVKDDEKLLETTFSYLNAFGLNSTVLLKIESGDIVARADKGPITPKEVELFEIAKRGERIIHIGNKYLFSGNKSIFLIKNMPIHDEDLNGRLRDHIAIMLESCDVCIELINYRRKEVSAQQNTASQTQTSVMEEFDRILTMFETLTGNSRESFDHLTKNIEESFLFLGLSEEQEAQLTSYVEDAREEADSFMDAGATLQSAMNRVAKSMMSLGQPANE